MKRYSRTLIYLLWVCAMVRVGIGQESVIQEKSNTSEALRGVSALAKGGVWASGAHGTYLRSGDYGNTWQVGQVPGAEQLDFRDVEAFSADVAYLLSAGPGEQSRIYKTIDAGKHWTLQFTNQEPKGFLDCMGFWDQEHGMAVGDPVNGKFQVIATENGKDWAAIPTDHLPAALDGEGAFAASGTCLTVEGKSNVWFVSGGKTARVFRSKDRGRTWTVSDTPLVRGTDSVGIFSVAFRDAKHGAIGGGDYKDAEKSAANLAFSDDGGATWKLSKISPQWFFSAVAFDPRDRRSLWVVGTSGAAYAEDVEAASWNRKWPVELNSLSFSPTGDAFAVGPKGVIVHFARPTLGAK